MDPQDMTTSYPLDKIRILLLEGIAQSAVDDLVKAGYTVETTHRLTPEELKLRIADFHVVGIRSKTRLTTEVLKSAKKLLCVGHFCIGTDQTDLEYARKVGIPVFNSPFANTRSVAELVLGEMIMLARQVPDRSAEVHRGVWNKVSRQCHEIRGKSLGIIGYGHVGQQLSVLAEAAGMRVRYVDIEPKLSIGNASASMELDEMLRESDFVSLHVPMTELTKNMISKEQIAMMKPCSYLINASRGKVVDVEATAAALKSGHLAGAAFDVYPQEPGSKTDEFRVALQGCRNTILTPHIGGSTEEAQHQIGLEVAHKLKLFINEGVTTGAVNFPQLSLPPNRDTAVHRLVNCHADQPGVLKSINSILGEYNISAQCLSTLKGVGYLMIELDKEVSEEVRKKVQLIPDCIKTRAMW